MQVQLRLRDTGAQDGICVPGNNPGIKQRKLSIHKGILKIERRRPLNQGDFGKDVVVGDDLVEQVCLRAECKCTGQAECHDFSHVIRG